jgi:hypothetical protein
LTLLVYLFWHRPDSKENKKKMKNNKLNKLRKAFNYHTFSVWIIHLMNHHALAEKYLTNLF